VESGHYFQEKGAKAEKVIHDLSMKTFFTDWCYPNPPRPDSKELCDLLVVFDDTAIIWQIKDLKVDEKGRYKQADVDKNIRQLSGARRLLFDLKTPVKLSNPRRGEELFDPSKIKHVHLISVLMGEGEGPLPFMDSIRDYKVHVFTRDFADIVLNELDTITDFTAYLTAKESISNAQIIIYEGEENLLAEYLYSGRTFDRIKSHNLIMIDDSIWPAIQAKPEFIAKKALDKVSYGWDSMIDRAHEGSKQYERLARELARPDRFTRRVLSQAFFDAYGELVSSDHELLRRYMPLADTSYCFLIANDDEYPAARRRKMLGLMCEVARGLPPMNKRVIGVATGKGNRTYDFAFLYIETWTVALEERKKEIQQKTRIFVSPRVTHEGADEYPKNGISMRSRFSQELILAFLLGGAFLLSLPLRRMLFSTVFLLAL
jgi:hypothetical protein